MISSKAPIPKCIRLPAQAPVPEEGVEPEGESATNLLMAILEDEDDTAELSAALAEFTANAEALEPTLLAEAKHHPDWPQWEARIREELATLQAAGTWKLADLPKWVFRMKKDTAGNVVHHKARLVAQGFLQVPGVDFFDTYAPVATLASI